MLVAAAFLLWTWLRPTVERVDVLALAERVAGVKHFRVELRDERIGRLVTETRVEPAVVRFCSRLVTALPGVGPAEVDETFVFSATAPFALAHAERIERQGLLERRVTIVPGPTGYYARIRNGGGDRIEALDWQYDLAAHLALESWLASQDPSVGATLTTNAFDFDRLGLIPTHYVVSERTDDGGWVVRSAASDDEQILAIDGDLAPRALSTGDAFLLVRTERGAPLEFRTRTHAADTRVPLDAAIENPRQLVRLTLAGDARTMEALGVRNTRGELTIDTSTPHSATDAERDAALAPSVDLPVSSPEILALLARVPRAAETTAQVDLLLAFVERTLVYDDETRSLDLTDALRTGRGDCTEFADLFTTLARALGIPARPANGLVYADIDGPGFYVHAWSEVAIDGHWVAVDPTSGQRPADATHVPFPRDGTGFLRAYAALADMRLSVIAIDHR